MTDCKINKYSSRVCSLGTKSCVMKHEGIAERNEEIARLRQELEISRQNYREVVTANAGLSERVAELESIIAQAKPYIVSANHKAEARHDSAGEYYMDGVQYEIMRETEKLIAAIDSDEYVTMRQNLEEECKELRQRVAELEAAYAERGERMKTMMGYLETLSEDEDNWPYTSLVKDWFKDGGPI